MKIEEIKNLDKVIGTKQTIRALKEDKVKLVLIAKDADEHIIKNTQEIAAQKNVEINYVESMQQLGIACGIQVGAATVGILK
ncbi:MAG: 50S ribosomal protein L7ae-like protein [Peptoclostridium sp.]|uniref:ribosomal L7Ae/L30e/S12e/Gadd45 family protein n=1 Tax=Peptoclostridium sp. TaxID=1904860 RepID=UPI00139D70EE|nr:ribosomal L7Ae/L30e/S12e/Gadd45 family protein [Peptoclostridium sp.]MZQ74879.1 50S ribosomal protein L7ae-like protein [Peptoclostridium sp.]